MAEKALKLASLQAGLNPAEKNMAKNETCIFWKAA